MIQLSLYLITHCITKTDEGVDIQLHTFLTLALDGVTEQLHAPATYPCGKSTHYPFDRIGEAPKFFWIY